MLKIPLRVLYLENDAADAELVQDTLATEGISCDVTRVETEPEFVDGLQQGGFDLILADYTLPSFDGMSALRIVRQQTPDLPFIFVSGTLGEEVAIEALKIGATDYVLKSRLSRLAPSVQRALREAEERLELRCSVEALRRSEQELRNVIEVIPAMTFTALPDGSSVFVNSQWTDYTGLSVEATSGAGWQAALHPEDLARHAEKWQLAVKTGELFEDEARFRRAANGEYRWFLVRGVPLRDEGGQVVKWYGTLTDVEDYKRAEHELRRNEAWLAEAQRLMHSGSFVWNVSTSRPVYLSDEWYRIWGFDPERDKDAWEKRQQHIHPEDAERYRAAIDRGIKEKTDYDLEMRLVLSQGKTKWVRATGHAVLNAAGDLVQFLGSITDITERKRAEEERERLRQLEADLAHINRVSTLGELAASLSHELKQPIAATITNATTCLRWLKRDRPDIEEAREAVTRIVQDANRASEVIDRLRSFYKKDSPTERELIDVNELICEMLVLLRSEAYRYAIRMRTDLAGHLPRVTGDRVQLQQVLLNLLLNGIEAMTETGGELAIRSELGREGEIAIAVCDTGVGLPTEKADKIFNAFFTTKPQGSGMGLAISRSIVESHGGRLWAASNSGRGATFHFTLPTATDELRLTATGT